MEAALAPRAKGVRAAPSPNNPQAGTGAYERPGRPSDRSAEVALQLVATRDSRPVDIEVPTADPRVELPIRILNVSVASAALVLAAPVMALIALAIRLTSSGPAIYSQTRVGLDRRWRFSRTDGRRLHDHGGMPFEMYKFRSMVVDAEADGRAVWAQKEDPRVTLIGGFLRRTRLDELPQLVNVIKGDMNIVGPRPERPSIFAELREHVPAYALRQRVRPGITGWAQVNQAYDTCLEDVKSKVRLDLEYLQRRSVGLDLRIMSRTIPVMLLRRGGQ